MPVAHPPEFRRRAVELVRLGGHPVTQIARDLGVSYSCLRNWVRQADIDEGTKQGLTGDERAELVRLRRVILPSPLAFLPVSFRDTIMLRRR